MTKPKTLTASGSDAVETEAAEAWLDRLDPAATPADDPAELRRIGLALRDMESADAELHDAVAAARTAGRSWAQIGMVLGVTRQSALERFGRD